MVFALSPNNKELQLPIKSQDLLILNLPTPLLEVGVKLPLKDNVCPLFMLSLFVLDDNDFQFPSPSTQYSTVLPDNAAVKPSSRATIVK